MDEKAADVRKHQLISCFQNPWKQDLKTYITFDFSTILYLFFYSRELECALYQCCNQITNIRPLKKKLN